MSIAAAAVVFCFLFLVFVGGVCSDESVLYPWGPDAGDSYSSVNTSLGAKYFTAYYFGNYWNCVFDRTPVSFQVRADSAFILLLKYFT